MTLLWDVCPTSPLTNPVAKTINHCPSDIQMHCSACLLRRCNHTHFDTEDPSGYGLPSGALPDRPRDQSNNRHSARNHSDTWPNVSAYPTRNFITKLTDEPIPFHSILDQRTQALRLHISGLN